MISLHSGRALVAAALALGFLATPAHAQYFGQNKVQYDDFDWRVIGTDHFDVHFYPPTDDASMAMARAAERWNWRLSQVFDHTLTERKPVVLYANHPDFQQTNVVGGEIGLGTGGVTDAMRNRATQPFTGDFNSSSHVVGHELAHVFQYDIAASGPGIRQMGQLPLWLIEGMAEYLSVGRVDPHTAMWLRDAVLRGDVPTIEGLSSGRYFPYRYGQALMAYVGGTWGDRAVTQLYRVALARGLATGIQEATGLTQEQLSQAWARDLREAYLPLVQDREAPDDVGRELLSHGDRRGETNLAPVLSPDGGMVAFISERGLFSMDLFVADVETGEIIRRLTSTAREPHFDALNFLESAGTWSPDGRHFAYVVVDDGDNELRIADVREGGRPRSVEVPGVTALNDPAWSPDGRQIAFSGSSEALSDLYVYDLDSGQVTQLTNDMHAEIHPSWSPDGRTLVFATDRGPDTDMATLQFGPLRLAAMAVESRRIELLPSFRGAKHIDPQYSPDGRSVYFVSDRDGVSDIFRLDLDRRELYRVTSAATGVSGITALSPTLSVAARDGRLAFSIFKDNQYSLHTLSADEAVGRRVTGSGSVLPAGVLPPVGPARPGADRIVDAYLEAPTRGLPPRDVEYAVTEYDSDLALDYIGPPTLGVAANQFGTQIGGSISFRLGDLLGDRSLGVMAQAQGELKDVGAQLFYENREDRINWAAFGGRIPYRSGRRAVQRLPTQGDSILVRDQILRTYLNQVGGQIAYPFSRTRRVEGSASFTRYTFDAEEQRFLCGPTGRNCDPAGEVGLEDLEADPINLYQATGAFVGDWANFGFTGPVAGGRYRLEVEPTFGALQFTAALVDYRRYFFWNPLTLAVKGLHYGRYGQDADNRDLLTPLFLGATDMVRGYGLNTFRTSECSGLNGGDGCPEFDRLVGSKVAVGNVELRLPLLGTEDFGVLTFPLLPTTVGAFFDAGVAWSGAESPVLEFATTSTERVPVASTGLFARVNLLGYMVLSTWYAHPFQRPEQDWEFGFQLSPGW